MPLSLQKKKEIVSKIHKIANVALSIVTANARGVTANDINELRKSSRDIGVKINIVRNTLLNLAIQGTSFECLKNKLNGPTLIAYSLEHEGSAARLFKNFAKKNKHFKITGGSFENKPLSVLQVNHLADMPTYNEAITFFVTLIKEVTVGKLIRTLSAVSNKKENN